ncbi:hypothetical protein BST97_02140 [Nonlabens spongiae]|uniref:Glycosyl transferase family 28 C-terminal domain-containing protein n=1 Tax=Nonlabens spongiae TaxID=331648 RepID=A0A1W6MHA9_9FLAO|nr:hypothetical protein [Nonlabens spongiae]ARN76896.1 hypothetical protein BST97_02140 [Nonlabens spongiae]
MIGYYAHSQGYGHCSYAQLLARELNEKLIIFTDSDFPFDDSCTVVHLENEDLNGNELYLENCMIPNYLHHNPVGLKKIQRRSRDILNAVIHNDISLMLIDVSVEVATLCRVSSIPYAYRRMPGNRNDTPHLEAYRGAVFLYAFYPKSCEHPDVPEWIKEKTIYLGFIAALDVKSNLERPIEADLILEKSILVIQGKGGNNFDRTKITELIQSFPDHYIKTAGSFNDVPTAVNYEHLGFVDDLSRYIAQSEIIFSACGSSTVSLLLQNKRKFICMPQVRPFEEQDCISQFLVDNELAVLLKGNDFQKAVADLKGLNPEISQEFEPRTMKEFSLECTRYLQVLTQSKTKEQIVETY